MKKKYNLILSKGDGVVVSKIVGKTKLMIQNNCLNSKQKIIVPKALVERIYDLIEKGVKYKRK